MIESLQNEKIKRLGRLSTDNRYRKKMEVFLVEGIQENERALRFHYEATEFYICESLFSGTIPKHQHIYQVSENVYKKIAYRGSTEGIIGVYKTPKPEISKYIPSRKASIILIEGIEKPGNLGAILRSCEAFGIEALIITNSKVDFYNPNVIRSSVGCLFGMNIFQTTNEQAAQFLSEHDIKLFTTYMSTSAEFINQKDLTKKSAILFGTEHSGISSFWKDRGTNVLVPMVGTIDSINLSNAVAITCYEILRQKGIQ